MSRRVRDLVFETDRSSSAPRVRVYLAADEGALAVLDSRTRLGGLPGRPVAAVRFDEGDRELRLDLPKWSEILRSGGVWKRVPEPKPAVSRLAEVRRARLVFPAERDPADSSAFGFFGKVGPKPSLRRPGFVLDLEVGDVALDEGLEVVLRLVFPVVRLLGVSTDFRGDR